MICSKCMASYPMGFKECPDCGASSKFAVLESEISNVEVDVAADTKEPISEDGVPELKITSLTDENMFLEGFVIPESKPPEEPEPPKPVKRRSKRKRKPSAEEVVAYTEENTYINPDTEETITEQEIAVEKEPVTKSSEDIVSEVEGKAEENVGNATKPEPVKRSSLFDSFAAEAAQSLAPEILPKIDTTKANNVTDVFKECNNIQPLETEDEDASKTADLRGVEASKKNIDTVPDNESNVAKIKPESKKSAIRTQSKQKPEISKEISRDIAVASVFGFLSLFIPIMFIPSNVYLNKIPKDVEVKWIRVLKIALNILFYINLFGLIFGIVSLTKALALNYQALFAGDFAPLTGEFGKIAPLAIIRGFEFWKSLFSAETGLWFKGVFDTYFSDFVSDFSQLQNGFTVEVVFSLFGKIGIPLIVILSSVGITGNIVYGQKIRALEKKLEGVYRIGNYTGETVRALKDKKRDLTFKKRSFVKTIIILVVLTFVLTEGYPIISKILPLLDFIKEDIQNTK